MAEIVPTLLAETPESYSAQFEKVKNLSNRIHIDISDGEFSPTQTILPNQISLPQSYVMDIHAMVARPSQYLGDLVALKPNLVIFHTEVKEDVSVALKELKKYNIKAGLALMRSSVPASFSEAIANADHVLIFTGNLGHYGGTASLMQIEKVRLIKKINPNAEIGWDGGVNADNSFTIAHGGISVLNVGGVIQNAEDPESVFDMIKSEANKKSVF